jgi:hypothetical protein
MEEISRRNLLSGLFTVAAAVTIEAPAIIRIPNLLMPVRNRLTRAEEITERLRQDIKRKHLSAWLLSDPRLV